MVESKSVRITCDFCRKVVAVKKLIGFRSVNDYCTIGREHIGGPFGDIDQDIHLCGDCYRDVRSHVVDALGKRRNNNHE